MFTKDQGKIKIMFQGAIQKNQNIKNKKKLQESKTVWYTVSKKMARSLHDQSTAVLRLENIVCHVYPEGNKKSTAQPTFVELLTHNLQIQ